MPLGWRQRIGPIGGSVDSAAGTVQSQTHPLLLACVADGGDLGKLAHVVDVPFLGAEKLPQGGNCRERADLISQDH